MENLCTKKKLIYQGEGFLNSAVSYSIPNLKEIIDYKAFTNMNGEYKKLPVIYMENNVLQPRFCIGIYRITSSNFFVTAGTYYTENISKLKLTITIRYTKTTD